MALACIARCLRLNNQSNARARTMKQIEWRQIWLPAQDKTCDCSIAILFLNYITRMQMFTTGTHSVSMNVRT
jgi:hypothetical protein